MIFRKARKKDIKQMLRIIKSNRQYPKKVAIKEIKEMFSKSLYKPTYIVAEENKGIITAFGGFNPSWMDSMIFNMFWVNTNPKYKNKGIGSKLIKELIKRIKSIKEKPKAKMIVISTKIPSFYRKFGFKRITSKYDREYVLMALNI